mgnify:CR=1 FL=1
MRATPREETVRLLREVGFIVKSYEGVKDYCFSVVAKKGRITLLIKCIPTLDSFTSTAASELREVAHKTQSTPLIVTSDISLEKGIVYKRYRINAVNYSTLSEALAEGKYPLIYAERGGFYVTIDGEKLHRARVAKGLSLGEVAESIGVSRKAIYEYERGCMASTPEVVLKLELLLGEDLAKPINFLKWHPEPGKVKRKALSKDLIGKVAMALKKWGFSVSIFKRTPFEAAALNDIKRDKLILKEVKWGNELEFKEVKLSSDFAKEVDARLVVLAKSREVKYEVESIKEDFLILNGKGIEEVKRKGIKALEGGCPLNH